MQYQRRQIEDKQRQRWEDTDRAQYYRDWDAGWQRRVRILKWATIIFAVQVVVWFILAWNHSPLAPIVFATKIIPAGYAIYIIGWSIKEL